MDDPVDALILDALGWIGHDARPYREVMKAWRTSCPFFMSRLAVRGDANAGGTARRSRHQWRRET